MPQFFLPVPNYGQTINSSFRIQSKKAISDLLMAYTPQQTTVKQLVLEIATSTSSILVMLILIALIYVFKFIKCKLQRKLNDLESAVYDIELA
ncbi:unnamed protein product [Adineta ricciae]|uniref:Uncharacterized protein n=1 Tax=Adineta ricciae TaxID=249248 RepID=A0A815LCV5_ADIRI|nr:unnamed protein product [Adineta ricciae]CAF1537554.1 unnamed protein product [Adineta ricciae]